MVYCDKCGKQNEDGVKFCINCGANLYPRERKEKEEDSCFGTREKDEDTCFGLPHGGAIAGIIFGALIIVCGFALILNQNIWEWIPRLLLVVFGVVLVAGAIYSLRRKSGI